MRLLNTFTDEMREFVVDIPHYAIISHTWAAEEVTYYDVVNKQGLDAVSWKQGYSKLMEFRREAARNGFKWIWMDSCCIDKTSSAELSEAINSMFAWYRDAVVCYVYLFDFLMSEGSEFHFAISGARSRWFTRGWTLQELLAPENLVFYDQNWKDCGSKHSLAGAISSITGIDHKVLSGETPINDYSIAQKMSWASMRETTRVEDIAYSLMGIFGITMPLLYGEGLRSFARLQEEIIKTSTDQTIFAWRIGWLSATEDSLNRGLLASSPADFQDSGRIVRGSDQSVDEGTYSITNTGLLVDLPLIREEENFVGVLNCHDIHHSNTRLGILLKNSMFLAKPTSTMGQSDGIARRRVLCQRISPDLLRTVQAKVIPESVRVSLTITPLWTAPASRAARFPLVDVSLETDLGESGFSLARSSTLMAQDSPRKLMSYIFGHSTGKLFGIKLQVDNGLGEAVRSRLEVMVSGEAALDDWTTELVSTTVDEAEEIIEANEGWRLKAKIRHRIKENRRGQILSLILQVSLESIPA
ncbi:hypothetical protein BP5796_12888 [Coleophoma crateriformis]|uniref:Uncharacterized protein n=1 Tax=Coleophoma crateriformis TaxID=565419 RepID=A0A3D8Q4R7_9HELO|nr:hypothetical protein BP5796_12888 [Coleophoma crateriformis]